jgi:hypothetical protein
MAEGPMRPASCDGQTKMGLAVRKNRTPSGGESKNLHENGGMEDARWILHQSNNPVFGHFTKVPFTYTTKKEELTCLENEYTAA